MDKSTDRKDFKSLTNIVCRDQVFSSSSGVNVKTNHLLLSIMLGSHWFPDLGTIEPSLRAEYLL